MTESTFGSQCFQKQFYYSPIRQNQRLSWRLTFWLFFLVLCLTSLELFGQETKVDRKPVVDGGPGYVAAEETVWEFGLRIEATGATSDITATCPVPVGWPEQDISELEQVKTANISRMSFDDQPQEVRLLVVKINQLNGGDVAEAKVRFRVAKKTIVAPEAWEGLKIPEKPKGKLKPYLQASPYIETSNKDVKAFAESIELDESVPAWQQVESIYDQVRERIVYEFDPTIRTCMDAIERGKGDCEEMSSLFIAVCRLKGIPARAVWIPEHTYPEFYLEDEAGVGFWFPCQLAGSRQFGGMIEARPVLQKGDKFKVTGSSQPARYVLPTLVARTAASNPRLVWISREVKSDASGNKGR
jgi:hypothetical protein